MRLNRLGAVAGRAEGMVRLGCVKYLNARPLVHGWPGPVVFDHPATLCAQVARGELDVALVSSFEFLRNPIYRIVDGLCISSDGPTHSVIVAHLGEFAEIKEIELDPASETSVNLLRCLLIEKALSPRLTKLSTAAITSNCGRLLIGDQAIKFRQEHGNQYCYWDLGEAWKNFAQLPFVYALWLIRPEVSGAAAIAEKLRALFAQNIRNIANITAAEKEFAADFYQRYFTQNLRFSFGAKQKEGLRTFAKLCAINGLIRNRKIVFDLF